VTIAGEAQPILENVNAVLRTAPRNLPTSGREALQGCLGYLDTALRSLDISKNLSWWLLSDANKEQLPANIQIRSARLDGHLLNIYNSLTLARPSMRVHAVGFTNLTEVLEIASRDQDVARTALGAVASLAADVHVGLDRHIAHLLACAQNQPV